MKEIKFIKRLFDFGRYSRALILPKILLDNLGWKKKQKIEIIPDFKKKIVIIRKKK